MRNFSFSSLVSLYPFFELSFGKCPFCVCILNLLVGYILGKFRFIFFFSKETMHNWSCRDEVKLIGCFVSFPFYFLQFLSGFSVPFFFGCLGISYPFLTFCLLHGFFFFFFFLFSGYSLVLLPYSLILFVHTIPFYFQVGLSYLRYPSRLYEYCIN